MKGTHCSDIYLRINCCSVTLMYVQRWHVTYGKVFQAYMTFYLKDSLNALTVVETDLCCFLRTCLGTMTNVFVVLKLLPFVNIQGERVSVMITEDLVSVQRSILGLGQNKECSVWGVGYALADSSIPPSKWGLMTYVERPIERCVLASSRDSLCKTLAAEENVWCRVSLTSTDFRSTRVVSPPPVSYIRQHTPFL